MFAPHPGLRLYLGADANGDLQSPCRNGHNHNKDIGIIGGVRILIVAPTKIFFGGDTAMLWLLS